MDIIMLGEYPINIDLLPEIPLVISGGIGNNLIFEGMMVTRFNAKILCYDFTDKSEKFFKSVPRPNMIYIKLGLSNNREIKYFSIDNSRKYSTSEFLSHQNNKNYNCKKANCLTIEDIISKNGRIDVLKLDIEGSEYGFLMELKSSEYIKQITAEFHDKDAIPEITEEIRNNTFKHLEKIGYKLISTVGKCRLYCG